MDNYGMYQPRMANFGQNQYSPISSPYFNHMAQNEQNNALLRVNGLDGAKAYQMQPNQTIALFDSNEDVFYIKSSDAGGFSSINAYRFARVEEVQPQQDMSQFVTRQEFEELKEMLKDVKQPIRKQSANTKQSTNEQQ